MEFKYDGGGLAKGGNVALYVDGKQVGDWPRRDDAADGLLGRRDLRHRGRCRSPVSPDYGPKGNEFSGEVNWVQIDLEKDDHDHLISPEERLRVIMARQ